MPQAQPSRCSTEVEPTGRAGANTGRRIRTHRCRRCTPLWVRCTALWVRLQPDVLPKAHPRRCSMLWVRLQPDVMQKADCSTEVEPTGGTIDQQLSPHR